MGLNMNEYCLVDFLKSKFILSVLGEECRFLKHENIGVPFTAIARNSFVQPNLWCLVQKENLTMRDCF